MSDAWEEIQAIKSKRYSLRERLEKRKKERQDILGSNLGSTSPNTEITSIPTKEDEPETINDPVKIDPEQETELLKILSEISVQMPIVSLELVPSLKLTHKQVCNLLEKFATQKLITVKETLKNGGRAFEVTSVEVSKVNAMILEFANRVDTNSDVVLKRKRDEEADTDDEKRKKEKKRTKGRHLILAIDALN